MKYGLRIPSFALGPKTAGLQEMGSTCAGPRTLASTAR